VRGLERRPSFGEDTDRTDVVARLAHLETQGGITGYI
jgi:hypothetical protein